MFKSTGPIRRRVMKTLEEKIQQAETTFQSRVKVIEDRFNENLSTLHLGKIQDVENEAITLVNKLIGNIKT